MIEARPMFSLDRSKNDTSVTLDLLRAVAVQMVCVGHANNYGAFHTTALPSDGVLIFFLLSGFLIAYTLDRKSSDPSYSIVEFGIERFARIYTAYLPALLLIGIATLLLSHYGKTPADSGPADLRTFVGNLFMLQNDPGPFGVRTYGTSGHLTSIAVEFHIYFLVGGLFFALKGPRRWLAIAAAVVFHVVPLRYFETAANSDHTLFALWLLGFTAYFVCRSIAGLKDISKPAGAAFVAFLLLWLLHRTPGDDYNLGQYPLLALAFAALVIFTQHTKIISQTPSKWITFAADYSFSLFLIHLTLIRVVFLAIPERGYFRVTVAVVLVNLLAVAFWYLFERRYHDVASAFKRIVINRPATSGAST
jgi:peptidoglycan/LPS O-acetylase OafA/YrhL